VHFLRRHFLRTSQAILALMLAGLVLFLDAMAVCPSLHELIHKDADSPEHQCAVTLFAHGLVDSVAVDAAIPAPVSFAPWIQSSESSAFTPTIENLPAGRAPPAGFSPS
jgi:xanthine/uracil permease